MKAGLLLALMSCALGQPLRLVQTIPMPGVNGRIDHLAADVAGGRLFVAALGNNTVEVLDLKAGKRIRSIAGLHEPQGIAYVPELGRIFVAGGGDGQCRIYDARSLAQVATADFSADADNVRYDAAARQIYVGYGSGALGIMDAPSAKRAGEIPLNGHPESFQLERSGPRIFVNVPTARHIAVIDRQKRTVIARWPVEQAAANFPMALNEEDRRLFIGCRKPARVLVYDTGSGKVVTSFACAGDTDDLFFDARKRLYVSGGEGFISIFAARDADHYEQIGKLATAAGARTSLFVPDLRRFFLAVPHRGSQGAEIRVYE